MLSNAAAVVAVALIGCKKQKASQAMGWEHKPLGTAGAVVYSEEAIFPITFHLRTFSMRDAED